MEAGAAQYDEDRSITAALAAGLRAIPARRLPSYAPGHTARGRVWFVTVLALACGPALEVVAVSPALVTRVRAILARPFGDVALERIARWVERGGLDA